MKLLIDKSLGVSRWSRARAKLLWARLVGRQLAAHLVTLAVAAGLWAAGAFHLAGRLQKAHDARFAAGVLRQRLVEARLSAETFLSRDVRDARFFVGLPLPAMEDFSRAMSDAEDRIAALERLRPGDGASTERLRALVEQYQRTFLEITELHRRQGFADRGLEGEWRKALEEAGAAVAGHPDLVLQMMEIRTQEKDYLLRRDPSSREAAVAAAGRLGEARLPPAAAAALKRSLDRYRKAFDEYAAIDREIGTGGDGGLRAAMAAAAQEMEPIARGLHEDSVRAATRARRALWSAGALVLLAGLLLGAGVAYLLAHWVARPLERLRAAALDGVDLAVPAAGTEEVRALGRVLSDLRAGLQRARRDARETNDRLRAVLDGTTDAVFAKDLDGHYVVANTACARLLGHPREDVLGRTDAELTTPEAAAEAGLEDHALLESGETRTYELLTDRGAFLTTRGVLRDADGRITGVFGISREVTERRRGQEELNAARQAAHAAARAKGELLAHMSHEIRARMDAVLIRSRLLLDGEESGGRPDHALAIRTSAEAMLAFLEEILELSRLEAGRVELRAEAFDVEEALAEAVGGAARRAEEKGIELALRVDPAVPRTLVGDAGRWRQALGHLAAEAVERTERGEVLVSVDAFDLGREQAVLRVLVADTGAAIPAAARERVFEPFGPDGVPWRRSGGAGLRLAISARLAALMGGRIDVDEAPGRGNVFTFTARLRAAAAEAGAAAAPALPGLPALVVDDNKTARKIVLERLAGWGLRGTGAGSEEAALAAVAHAGAAGEPFALAVVDADLPGGGFELGARMAREDGVRGPVVYVLSANGGGDAARVAAPAWSLTRPVLPSKLLEVLQRALGSGPPPPDGPFDEAKALDVAQGDRAMLRELARLFRTQAPKTLSQARTALRAGDLTSVAQAAHTLKGSTTHFCAIAATDSLRRLEDAARNGTEDVPLAVEAAEREIARLCQALAALG